MVTALSNCLKRRFLFLSFIFVLFSHIILVMSDLKLSALRLPIIALACVLEKTDSVFELMKIVAFTSDKVHANLHDYNLC